MKTNFKWDKKKGFGPLAIIIVVAIVAALGGGAYYYSKNHSSSYVEESMESSSSASVSADASTNGSIRDLLALGRNVMCTLNQSSASSNISGTVYVSGSMMRGDFTSKSQSGASVDSHMIRNNNLVYAWSGSQGAKMDFSTMSTSTQSNSNVSLDQKVNYKCSSWSPDNSKFTIPSNINFIDVGAMMKTGVKAGSGGASANTDVCVSVCGSLNGQAKTQCMSAYHCQ